MFSFTQHCVHLFPCPAEEEVHLQDVCLLLGTSLGYLQLHAEDGQLLHRQRLHTTSAQAISVRVAGMGTASAMHGCCAARPVLDWHTSFL